MGLKVWGLGFGFRVLRIDLLFFKSGSGFLVNAFGFGASGFWGFGGFVDRVATVRGGLQKVLS